MTVAPSGDSQPVEKPGSFSFVWARIEISSAGLGLGFWLPATWILLQLDKDDMTNSGYTFVWGDARSEPNSMTWHGLELYTTPPELTTEECQQSVESGNVPCSQ